MSGPKAADYYVLENTLWLLRALEEAWARARELEARLRDIRTRAEAAKGRYQEDWTELNVRTPDRPSDGCTLSALESYVSALRLACNQLEADLQVAVARVETRRALVELTRHVSAKITTTEELFRERSISQRTGPSQRAGIDPVEDAESRREKVARVLGRLTGMIPRDERAELDQLAAEIIHAESRSRAEGLELELRMRVQRLNERSRALAQEADQAAALLAQLRGLDDPEVQAVARELERVERQEARLTDDLRRRSEEVARVARARADHAYAAGAIQDALTELGYEVGDGFSTLFVDGGRLHLQKASFGDYCVQMRVDPDRGRLDFNLARFGDEGEQVTQQQRIRDREMEERWCAEFDTLMEALRRRRIGNRVATRVPPGRLPVRVIHRGRAAREGRRAEAPMPRQIGGAPMRSR